MARPVASKTFKMTVLSGALGLWVAILSYAQPSHAQIHTFPLSYSGRLTASGGQPLQGPIDLQLRFWDAFSGGTALSDSFDFSSVVLNQGVFQVRIAASSDQIEDIFGDGTKTVFVEVTAKGVTYPRQEFTFIPLALRVPVDNKTVGFASDGKLTVVVPARTSPTSVLSIDNQGKFTWEPLAVSSLQSKPVSQQAPTSGQVLTYDGTQWTPAAVTQATGNYITKITGDLISSAYSSGTVTGTLASVALPGTSTKVTYDAKGRITSGTSLSASDIPPLSASAVTSGTLSVANGGTGADLSTTGGAGKYLKQSTVGGAVTVGAIAATDITASLGFSPVNSAGDTLSGGLNAGGFDLSNTGNVGMAASKTLLLSNNASDPNGLSAADKGRTWFNSATNEIKYWDGSSAVALGVAGSGLGSLNGQAGNTQTFATPGSSGTAPSWSSASNAHTLNIPMASASSVTAGLISNADYSSFTSKVSSVAQGTGVAVATASGTVTVSLAATGTAGSYAKVMTDAYGRVTAGTTLSASDIPPLSASTISSGALSVTNGGTGLTAAPTNGQLPVGNGTGYTLSTLTAGTGINISNASGSITVSATADPTTRVAKSGDTMIGALTLPVNGLVAGTNQLVLASGNVGIGTTSPAAALDINGQIKIQGGTPGAGKVLTSDGSGLATWSTAAVGSITGVTAGTGLTGGGTSGAVTLNADVGTTGNKLVQLDATAKLPAVDGSALTNLNPSNLSSAVGVAKGGTGLTSGTSGGIPYFNATNTMATSAALTSNGVVLGGGTGAAPTATAAGTANTVLRVPSGGGAPSFGALDVSQSSTVTGTLNLGNGGTGASLLLTGGAGQYLKQTASGAAVSVDAIAASDLPSLIGDSGSGGTKGAVPAPASGDSAAGKFLKADGTWSVPSGTTNWAAPGAIGSSTPNTGAFTTLTASGNVGIGTTAPAGLFDVAGNLTVLASGNVGIGLTTPTSPLAITANMAGTTGLYYGMTLNATVNPASSSTAFMTAGSFGITSSGPYDTGRLYGLTSAASHQGTGLVSIAYGAVLSATNNSSGTLTNAVSLRAALGNSGSGTIANGYGLKVDAPTNSGGGSITNYFGLHISAPTVATNNYSIYSTGGTNYLGGNVGIGTTSPAGKLDVAGSICLNGANCITSWPNAGGYWATSGSDSYVASGKLGVGTSSPGADLSFGGTLSRTIQVDRNTGAGTAGGGLTVQAGGAISGGTNYNGGTLTIASGVATGTGTSGIEFKTASGGSSGATDSAPSTKMTILGNGNVGIGTTAPADSLDIWKSSGTNQDGLSISAPTVGGAGSQPALKFKRYNAGTLSTVAQIYSGYTNGDLIFATGSSASPTMNMVISAAGNVGVGAGPAPLNKLDVGGNMAVGASYAGYSTGPSNGLIVQGNVGIGTTSPVAALDINSTSSGFLPPRLTTAQRDAIAFPTPGMVVYNTTIGLHEFYNGSAWTLLGSAGSTVTPAGIVSPFSATTCPTGWIEADGSAVSRTTYSGLFGVVGTTFGAGNGSTTFNLPDLRGEFVRGFDNGRGVDSGRVFGSAQAASVTAIGGSGNNAVETNGTTVNHMFYTSGSAQLNWEQVVTLSGSYGWSTVTSAASNAYAGQVRPRNMALKYCISTATAVQTTVSSGGSGAASYIPKWTSSTDLGNSPMAVSGGNVGIGTTAPTAALDVTGSANISGGVGTVIWSTQPGSRYTGMSGSWSPTGESLTITVPTGSSRRYRVVMRQTLFNNNVCTLYVALSTSNTAPTSSNSLFMPGISLGAGYTGPVNAETYVTLAPGSYTYYVMAIFTGGSPNGSQVLNSTGDNRMYSDVFAVQM